MSALTSARHITIYAVVVAPIGGGATQPPVGPMDSIQHQTVREGRSAGSDERHGAGGPINQHLGTGLPPASGMRSSGA